MLALDRHPVCCLLYLHRRMAGQQITHHARMRRIEVLDQNERHAGAGREGSEQPPGRIEAASRGADRDDWKITTTARGERTLQQTWSIRPLTMRMTSRHSAVFLEERRSM